MTDTGYEDESHPIFQPGVVVYGVDPFKREEAARPWLIVSNHEGQPFHGEQYIALTLTTKSWMGGLVDVEDGDWIRGETPEQSRIVPWGVQSISPDDVDFWRGGSPRMSSRRPSTLWLTLFGKDVLAL